MEIMKKEVKNIEQIVSIIFVVLTAVSLLINAIAFTGMVYNDLPFERIELINNVVASSAFYYTMWISNILLFAIGFLYLVIAIKSKKEVFIKVSFVAVSVLTSIIMSILIINFVAELFGIF